MTRGRSAASGRRVMVAASLFLGLATLALASGARAESWGGITPGQTARPEVERLYGRPSRERTMVEEGRTVSEWTYAGERAPQGMERVVISYGDLIGGRFVPDVVRAVTLYPKPRVFTFRAIMNGWGKPDAIGTEEATGRPALHYRTQGLFIILDKTESWAEVLVFGPRLPSGS